VEVPLVGGLGPDVAAAAAAFAAAATAAMLAVEGLVVPN